MGQKVSPVGLRIGINKDWESKWYAPNKDFAKYLNTDIKIREYLEKNLKGSSVASVVIERNKKRTKRRHKVQFQCSYPTVNQRILQRTFFSFQGTCP